MGKQFLQTLDKEIYNELEEIRKKLGLSSVQELIRARIIPDWLKDKEFSNFM